MGSSPLTRGKLHAGDERPGHPGLIPAHAGKTPTGARVASLCRAHPRSRGENRAGSRNPVMETGSSPLTRGKRDDDVGGRRQARLIPAHAGKTRSSARGDLSATAHPRSRGENRSRPLSTCMGIGSSPLTRGKLPDGHAAVGELGLIPAHAGKTQIYDLGYYRERAHPRSRGENPPTAYWPTATTGSSPLTRGTHSRSTRAARQCGLIPAHAGKTMSAWVGAYSDGAHPRSRGENPCRSKCSM